MSISPLLRSKLLAVLSLFWASASGQSGLFLGEALTSSSHGVAIAERQALDEAFTAYSVFSIDGVALNAHARSVGDGWTGIRLKLGNQYDWDLQLVKHDLRSPDYTCRVATPNGVEVLPKGEVSTYRGYLGGDPANRARFSIRDNTLLGMVLQGDEEYYIEPLSHFSATAPADQFVVYTLADVITDPGVSCGNTEMMDLATDIGATAPKGGDRDCMLADIALAADGSMVTFLGSVNAVEVRMLDILNWVEGRYLDPRIEIAYRVVTTFISPSTAMDPWSTTTDASSLLGSFRTWGNGGGFGSGVSYAVASMWTRRNISGGVIGIASVGAVCTANRYNLNEYYTTTLASLGSLQAHELGHNWSAQHTPQANNTYIMSPSAGTNNTQWDDAAITSINNHKNSRTCLSPSCALAPFAQFAASRTISCDGTVSFTDLSTYNPASWLWEFGDGNTSTLQNPTHTYASDGTYTVRLTTSNANGQDIETKPGYITVSRLDPPTTTDGARCGAGVVDLQASGSNRLRWYAAPTGGAALHSGPTYSPNISVNTTYYVENSTEGDPVSAGPATNTIGTGAYFTANDNWGVVFNALRPITLKSVKVYSGAAGNRTIQLINNGGAVVQSMVVNIPNGESRVALDMDIAPGNQYLLKVTGSLVNLYRNDAGAAYPYVVPGLVSITGNNASNAPGNFYYFYDWVVQEPGCSSARTAVTGLVDVCTGIDELRAGGFSVQPNPSEGRFLVEWGTIGEVPARFEVLNTLGQKVMEEHVEGRTSLSLWIDGGQGLYFLRAFDRQGNLLGDRKLVLQ